jgi:hypothetical protein
VGLAALDGLGGAPGPLGPIARLEARIRAAPPKVALALFLVPAVMLFPIKLVALWLIHLGQTSLACAVILRAKALGTALVGRLFIITEPQLTSFLLVRALARVVARDQAARARGASIARPRGRRCAAAPARLRCGCAAQIRRAR